MKLIVSMSGSSGFDFHSTNSLYFGYICESFTMDNKAAIYAAFEAAIQEASYLNLYLKFSLILPINESWPAIISNKGITYSMLDEL